MAFPKTSGSTPVAALLRGGILAFAAGTVLCAVAAIGLRTGSAAPATSPATTAPATRTAEQKKQDDIQRVMAFFRLTQPDVYDQAKTLSETNPPKFEKLISGAIPTVNHLESMRKKNPKLFDLSMQDLQLGYQSLRMAHELKRTDMPLPEREQLTTQLKAVVAQEFDVQQQIRQLEIDDLQKKVTDLQGQVKVRENDKENIIGKRVDDLVERTPRLEW